MTHVQPVKVSPIGSLRHAGSTWSTWQSHFEPAYVATNTAFWQTVSKSLGGPEGAIQPVSYSSPSTLRPPGSAANVGSEGLRQPSHSTCTQAGRTASSSFAREGPGVHPAEVPKPEIAASSGRAVASAAAVTCDVPDLVRFAERGDFASVLALLEGGEDPNRHDDFNLTALHGAAKKGHGPIVELLLSYGARVESVGRLHGEMPLHYACKYGHADVVALLLDGKAEVHCRTLEGRTPMQYAQMKNHIHIQALLSRALLGTTPS